MADYYCQTSVLIPFDTDQEKAWLEAQLTLRAGAFCTGCQHQGEDCVCVNDYDSWEEIGGWEFEISKDALLSTHCFWVHGEEYVTPHVLADLVADYQTTFAREDFWECSFAYTCSKPHVDSFSGMKVLVYRGREHYFGRDQDLENLEDTLSGLNDFAQTLPQHL